MDIYISQLDETQKILNIIKKYNVGLEVVQFASPYILDDKDMYLKTYKDEIKDIYGKTNISVHGPYADLSVGSRDKDIAKVTKKRLNEGYNIAKKLGAKKIVYHNGYTPNTYTKEEWLNNAITFWNDFLADKDDNIDIHIENTMEEDYLFIKELVDNVNHKNFSVCLDIGHVNVFSNISVNEWLEGLGGRIKHFHIHNNYGLKDSHSSIESGNINIIELIKYINKNLKNSSISLEIVDTNELINSLEILKKNGLL
ncbi:sugar phosphate isomerase/epimerase family protein [Romboutsia sp. 1001216sp1]|uniref:sugar phosphate isomerase/epimerase family protein n=1 Tax=Romboutsia sp. 1001216sp1 TaxID=2986997 RepID=UPI00233056ED|nr:sugar phosphate isomerase/epimerase family protein [Romboutsia sp. 1001216sp1]MDB8804308.1 sugar phosphate isomerase/epimerase [Romboutsia sp. 1001216sp1]MDB8807734.1 sugar phosphate isomerase/epimerase [Romboutsia sp. 1001216sp1]MDB8809954.1 sugar phosphate isomerase/epimerase [Romboutsia sp. 1001216sp1]MDB8815704.1 sugar phosphate isomerase/epimerase [Romboutsia sp. 1001216sp1]MDB8819448.1 sugar phosphate isomerase/epimerase [Romboutsia sp. 1001216sp1]